jgi:hypothetical protein
MTTDKTPQKPADAKARQEALDSISAEDLEKIKAHQASTKGSFPVDQEWLLLAEFGMKFGWQAYLDAKNDSRDENGNLIVSGVEMLTLIEASRKIEWAKVYNDARSSLIGTGSAQSKKPAQTFKSLTADIIKQTKVDE